MQLLRYASERLVRLAMPAAEVDAAAAGCVYEYSHCRPCALWIDELVYDEICNGRWTRKVGAGCMTCSV
ncbi:hypothetical protein I0C86_18045 [Plantactinospora sp. S1510]|uniref:Uncharacterized protein n=1 Tax=Plantactinospora alkalitolerans TaxID=2789879 RepID=A0ABS0GXE2_9ACTN|nr:hypothetical protein [Plantactinospora alkalitolerans]MBF9130845.1 hypothetical protein [Plantactinospora alkalitolerans]